MKYLKGTKIYSILTGACPVCQNESMYTESNPYIISQVLKMEERCSHCNTKYKIEPSFFFGAMYVSYPVGIAFASATFVLCYLVLNINILTSFFIICAVLLGVLPIIIRVSRNIWINFFMHYEKPKNKVH